MSTAHRRASIGFQGGQVLSVRLADGALQALRDALSGPAEGWHVLATEDGEVNLDLKRVVYLNAESDEHRIGFS